MTFHCITCVLVLIGLDFVHSGTKFYCQMIERINCQQRPESETCGSDGKTYYNMCALSVANCADPRLTVAHSGPCNLLPTTINFGAQLAYDIFCMDLSHHACPADKSVEICASNNATYRNLCEFDKARCTNRHMYVRKYGPCS